MTGEQQPPASKPEPIFLECWVSNGGTYCMDCASCYTGAKPVKLQAPRTCRRCRKEIKDPWPEPAFIWPKGGLDL